MLVDEFSAFAKMIPPGDTAEIFEQKVIQHVRYTALVNTSGMHCFSHVHPMLYFCLSLMLCFTCFSLLLRRRASRVGCTAMRLTVEALWAGG